MDAGGGGDQAVGVGRVDSRPGRTLPVAHEAQTLGVWTLTALALLLASGVPMAFVYQPDPAAAHGAVERLATGGWRWLRGAHGWAASAAVALTLVHVARGYVTARVGVIGRGRALAGLATFVVVVAAFFSGTILAWDQQGWEAYQHWQLAGEAVGAGEVSDAPESTPLGLVFWLHVLAVPLFLVVGLLWHFAGRASMVGAVRRVGGLVRARVRSVAAVVVVLVAAGRVWPPELGPAPLGRLVVAKPDWPFLWLVPLQDAWGAIALWLLPLAFLVAAVLIVWPVRHGTPARRAVVVALAVLWGVLTWMGWR